MEKVKIERLNDQLDGIGYINGKIVFVPKCSVGDDAEVLITEDKKSYAKGKLISPLKKVDCPYYYNCGGCNLRHLSYEETLKLKEENFKNLLNKNNININKVNIYDNRTIFNYRNKISLKIVDRNVGYFEESTNDLVNINECLLAKEEINKLIPVISDFGINNGLVTIRCNYNNELLIIIETEDKIEYDFNNLKDSFKIAGVVLNGKTILNDDFFFDKINDLLFKVSYDSFFQVNNLTAGYVFDIISKNIVKDDTVLDLYSGVGTLSICASKKAKNVLGVEVVKNAVLNALVNKKINKVDNVEFALGDVPKVLSKLNNRFNTFIFDPPRKGLDKFTTHYTLSNKPNKIIYVSCNPITLVRDLKLLEKEYTVKEVSLIDMFSYTYHVECVTLLCRKTL